MPDCPIIDTHVHFWNNDQAAIDWVADIPALNRAFEPGDLTEEAAGVDVEGLIFVEAAVNDGAQLDEVAWVAQLAQTDRRFLGIVAHAPVHLGAAVRAHLDALAEIKLVKGVRRLLQQESDPAFCLSDDFLEGVRTVGEVGLHFEICVVHPQLAHAAEMVRRCPEVSFVLNHIGKPDIKNGLTDPWRNDLKDLAACPNAFCKLSGVATEADLEGWTESQLRPYVDHTLQCFGPDRTMFGGDWPVSKLALSYPRWTEIVDAALADYTGEDIEKIYGGNAKRIYRTDDIAFI